MGKEYVLNGKSALVLEGGGMRGAFTAGVLENFLDRDIHFPYTIGVSAGSSNALSYVSRQKGRIRYANMDLMARYRYISVQHLLRTGNIMDMDLMFNRFPNEIWPFDYAAFSFLPDRLVFVTSNCLTGQAEYLEEKHDPKRLMALARASSSLPPVSRIVNVDGIPLLDGCITDPIPLRHVLEEGFTHPLVVLTRNRGYRKKPSGNRFTRLFYKKYPQFCAALETWNDRYNRTLDWLERMEDEGSITVLRPVAPILVSKAENDPDKIVVLYDEGYRLASLIKIALE